MTTTTINPRPTRRWFAFRLRTLFVVVAVAAVPLAWIGMLNKYGTLIVEVNQRDVVVQVLDRNGNVEISQPGGLNPISISVVPGKHRIMVEKEGFVTIADNFEIESGGKLDIKARLVPKAHFLQSGQSKP